MASYNQDLWQTVSFLFLSKFVKQAHTSFAQEELINAKNIDLAERFTQMVGDKTEHKKIKLALLKALRQLETDAMLIRIDEKTLQLSDAGFIKMKAEVETAMSKIAQSFPESVAQEKSSPTVQ